MWQRYGGEKTPNLIPMCHSLMLSGIDVSFSELTDACGLKVEVSVKCKGKTDVEMEALTAVSTALLTIYGMCKAVDKGMVLTNIQLEEKRAVSLEIGLELLPQVEILDV